LPAPSVQRVIALILLFPAVGLAEPLTLERVIDLARSNDLRVKEAQAELRILRGRYQEAKWYWFPKLDTNILIAGPTPEARNDGLGGPPTTESTLMYDFNFGTPGVMFSAEATGVLPIYTFGKLTALEEAGAKGVEVGRALEVRARDEAQLQASQAYYGYQLAKNGQATVTEVVGLIDDAKKTLERLLIQESDQVTQMDLYKLDFYRQQAIARQQQATAGQRFATAAIRLLIGAKPEEKIELVKDELELPGGAPDRFDAYLALAFENRPELRAIEAGIVAREREVFIRERLFYPDFGIAGFARWKWTTNSTRQLSPFAYDPYNDLSAGLAIVGHMTWDFPVKLAQLEQSRGELDKLMAQRDLLKRAVRLETDKAYSDLIAAQLRAEAQTSAERQARRWATAAMAAFELGTSDSRELVGALTAVATAGVERAQAAHDVLVGWAVLTRAVGLKVQPLVPAPTSTPPPPEVLKPK
jgi:outer membrane protein, multidrug efflux system